MHSPPVGECRDQLDRIHFLQSQEGIKEKPKAYQGISHQLRSKLATHATRNRSLEAILYSYSIEEYRGSAGSVAAFALLSRPARQLPATPNMPLDTMRLLQVVWLTRCSGGRCGQSTFRRLLRSWKPKIINENMSSKQPLEEERSPITETKKLAAHLRCQRSFEMHFANKLVRTPAAPFVCCQHMRMSASPVISS